MRSLGSVCISEYISFTDYKHAWQCSISQDQWHQPLVWLRAFVNQSSPPCKLIPSPPKKNTQSIRESVLMTVYCYKLLLHAWFVHLYDWTTTYKQVLKFYQGFIINNIWISTKAVKPRLWLKGSFCLHSPWWSHVHIHRMKSPSIISNAIKKNTGILFSLQL